jgi:hypothetical protein
MKPIYRRRGRPCEEVVQRATEPLVGIHTDVPKRQVETGNRPLIRLVVRTVSAVHPQDRRLISVTVGVERWATQGLGPVRSKALRVLRMETMAEGMTNHLVNDDASTPRMRQPKQALVAASGRK